MKALAISACALVLLTGVALSQNVPTGGENVNTEREKQDAAASRARQEQIKRQEVDEAYKAALAKTKAPAAPVDPWGAVRVQPNR